MSFIPFSRGVPHFIFKLIALFHCINALSHQKTPSPTLRHYGRIYLNGISKPRQDIELRNKKVNYSSSSRKEWLSSCLTTVSTCLLSSAFTLSSSKANAAETVGKDPECNDSSCLGIWDGLFADCPHGAITMRQGSGCASSQDDTPGVFAEPWDYSEAPNNSLNYEEQMRLLIPAIQLVSSRKGDKAVLLNQSGRYVRFLFTDGKTGEESVGEFYFTPNDTTVQFRVGTLNNKGPVTQSMRNLERCELIRKELRYQKIPVLRNRKRALFFVESDFDSFGPSLGAAGEDVDAKMQIDDYPTELIQTFPLNGGRRK